MQASDGCESTLHMNLQTRCTCVIACLFIVEILPVPFTSLYSLYAIRKRPNWLPQVTGRLYADKLVSGAMADYSPPPGHDAMMTRSRCTLGLAALFVVDLLIPVIIPTALYVVRMRPAWFHRLVLRLYADKLQPVLVQAEPEAVLETPEMKAAMATKLKELERQNFNYAQALGAKNLSKPHR